jgi:FMN phosphatase YigB (HAD superfamily)
LPAVRFDPPDGEVDCTVASLILVRALLRFGHHRGFAISYEVGATKPDRRMFDAALSTISTPAQRCLMVGDNPGPDTGAAALGISTLIVPVERVDRPALLHRVTSLAVPST